MKLLRTSWAVVMLLGVAGAARADDKKVPAEEAIVGRWQGTDPKDCSMEFTKDGKHQITIGKNEQEWGYTLKGDKVKFEMKIDSLVLTREATVKKLTATELEIVLHLTSVDGKPEDRTFKLKRSDK
jgi:uncharacterized protein (TIGR03066 family)